MPWITILASQASPGTPKETHGGPIMDFSRFDMHLESPLDHIFGTLRLLFHALGHSIDGMGSTGVYELLGIGNETAIWDSHVLFTQ